MSQPLFTYAAAPRSLIRLLALTLAGLSLLTVGLCPAWGQVADPLLPPVTSEQVAKAIQDGIAHLRSRQDANGGWERSTGLVLLALLNADVPANDPAVQKGLDYLVDTPNENTYEIALKCMALSAADPVRYRIPLVQAAQRLARGQLRTGMWTYAPAANGRGDNSNTQVALLGLYEAARAGVAVPPQVWARSHEHFVNTQAKDGGWSYIDGRVEQPYGSMTAAGVASLFITGDQLNVAMERSFANGIAPNCGRIGQQPAIVAGINWLAREFTVHRNPARGIFFHYYYLYALERVGMTGGLRYIGNHDWYREGASYLVHNQLGGAWGPNTYDTAFALLFLAKGNRPVLMQKLQWTGQWNLDPHDVANAVAYIGKSGMLGQAVTWQAVSVQAPVTDWLASPIVYLQGHQFPNFSDEDIKKIRQFIENGGTLLAEACCGSKGFRDGFEAFARKAFPEYNLRKLPLDHPLFGSPYKLDQTYDVMGMDVGCRTSVFYLPQDLSCLWEQRTVADQDKLVDFAFQFITNLAAYATGKEPLADKLAEIQLPTTQRDKGELPPRGAVHIARLAHGGDYNADPHALTNLTDLLVKTAKLDVVTTDKPLKATDPAIYDHPVLFMTGHFSFTLSDEEVQALKKYLQRGGLLVAESCCGRPAFDTSFRELAGKLLTGQPMTPLPVDHPIYTGKGTLPLGPMQLRPALTLEMGKPAMDRAPLEAGTVNGRTAVLYSPLDWSCGFEGDKPYACRGYVDADAKKLGVNILLYAISY